MTGFERFMSKVDASGDCWLWTGSLQPNGYARVMVDRRRQYVHRYAYEAMIGPIPEGLSIDHLCRVRHCVRPDHLEAVTHDENLRRSPIQVTTVNSRKTHCPKGHPYSNRDNRGFRECRKCIADRKRARRAVLGITTQNVYKHIHKHGIERPSS